MLLPDLYEQKPTPPPLVEAFRLTVDNLRDVAAWLSRMRAGRTPNGHTLNGHPFKGYVSKDGGQIEIPIYSGWQVFAPGDWLIHHGGGKFSGLPSFEFDEIFQSVPTNPAVCNCITPSRYGSAADDGPMVWEPECLVCGLDLTGRVGEFVEDDDEDAETPR